MTTATAKRAWRNRSAGLPADWQRTATRRYPTGPVEAFLRARLGPFGLIGGEGSTESYGYTAARAATMLNVHTETYRRAVTRGTLDETTADRWATRLGLHPADLWPEWWQVSA
jgi:hypothetical protein